MSQSSFLVIQKVGIVAMFVLLKLENKFHTEISQFKLSIVTNVNLSGFEQFSIFVPLEML